VTFARAVVVVAVLTVDMIAAGVVANLLAAWISKRLYNRRLERELCDECNAEQWAKHYIGDGLKGS